MAIALLIVIEIIKEEIKKDTPLEEISIMFRTHQYGRIIRKALDKEEYRIHDREEHYLGFNRRDSE